MHKFFSGSAFYTGACAYDPDEKKMEAFAILEDVGNFASMIPSAHEVGHLYDLKIYI